MVYGHYVLQKYTLILIEKKAHFFYFKTKDSKHLLQIPTLSFINSDHIIFCEHSFIMENGLKVG